MTTRTRSLPDLAALLSLDAGRGRISVGRERFILVSAAAMGALRKELVETVGPALAAEVLFRFGRRCGREDAVRVREEWGVADPARALGMGPLLHAFTGVARVIPSDTRGGAAAPAHLAGTWEDSYEADEHLRLIGAAAAPACWTLAGYASGYASEILHRELVCRETACRAAGERECRWVLTPADPGSPEDLPDYLRTAYAALEVRLRRQGELLDALADSSDDAVYTVDAYGTVTSWNGAAARIFGHSPAGILGRHERILLPAYLVDAGEDRRLGLVAAGGGSGPLRTARTWRVDASGRNLPASEVRSAILDARGEGVGATVVLHPLPATPPEDAERTLRTLLDGIPDGIALTTVDQRIVECNRAFQDLAAAGEETSLEGRTCHSLLARSETPCAECPTGELFQAGHPVSCQRSLLDREGNARHLDLRSFPLRDAAGRVTHELKVVRDVTGERERERELEEKRRLASLGEMSARLAHEVKNPLAGIRGALQVLGRRRPAGDPEREIFDDLIAHIDRLDTTVRDLLAFARPPQARLEETRPADVMEAALSLLRDGSDMEGITLRAEDHGAPAIPLDRQQWVQVLTNLVLNAAQALRAGDPREITLAASPSGDGVSFEVRDRGPGVAAADRPRLFAPFFTTKPRGTGLGLSICRKIAEAHGGTLEYEAPADGGSVFRARIPRRAIAPRR